MRSMVEGAGHRHGLCLNASSVGFAATSPVENGGGSATRNPARGAGGYNAPTLRSTWATSARPASSKAD